MSFLRRLRKEIELIGIGFLVAPRWSDGTQASAGFRLYLFQPLHIENTITGIFCYGRLLKRKPSQPRMV
jgi:hypothetical protein